LAIDKNDTKEKIILEAMEIIGKQVNMKVTTREIAKKAHVNLASINYYFRSKENLFKEVEKHLADKLQKIYDILSENDLPLKERLTLWAESLMQYLLDYPGIMFMWAQSVIEDQKKGGIVGKLISTSEMTIDKIITDLSSINNREIISFKVMQLLSGVINPVILYQVAGENITINIMDKGLRKRYITSLINTLIRD